MSENLDLPQPKNRVLGRTRLMEFLGVAAARLTTVRRFAPATSSRDQIRIKPQHHEVLSRLASERQTTVSALVETAIHDWLTQETKPARRKTPRRETPRRTSPRDRKESKKVRSKLPKPGATPGPGGTEE